uniref:Reverse transcriptase domain-containing protein n=1 Tax=Tanacetum cinerariifolium TaxID=118510 RepID=A0A6L2P1Q3_TANCI|nr:reverse transcriptase domain-containing protein [Tanacetum cinerariifolium]
MGTFHFPADFVVVDFDADPRVLLILGSYFLKTVRALIDVFEEELTLRVGKEAITFNLDQTLRYSANYNDITAKRIGVIDMACEEYSQEVLSFSDVIAKVDAFLALEDDPTSPEVDQSYVNTKGDILLLEAFLNDDPSLPPPNQGNEWPQVQKELKIYEAKTDKSSIDEPPKVELKDLPPHLEYAFLEEEEFEPAVQHQRRVNPKIHDVIKNEVLKLLDARLIYSISDSPWFAKVMLKFGVTYHLAAPYHPQTSGQMEVSNRGLKRIIDRTVGENRASWSDKLDDALWAFRTAYKTPIRCTPYKLVYGKACHLSIELEHKAY